MRVGSGVHLAHRGADPLRGLDLAFVGIDEHAHDDARLAETRHDALQRRLASDDVETALGRDFLPAFGDEHRHLGPDAARDADHLRRSPPSRG